MTGQSKDHPQVRRRQADDQTLRPKAEGERRKGKEEGRGRKEEGGEEEGVSRRCQHLPFPSFFVPVTRARIGL
jgi:hypothetical protein